MTYFTCTKFPAHPRVAPAICGARVAIGSCRPESEYSGVCDKCNDWMEFMTDETVVPCEGCGGAIVLNGASRTRCPACGGKLS